MKLHTFLLAVLLLPRIGQGETLPVPGDDSHGDCDAQTDDACITPVKHALQTLGAYATSPLRWDGREWLEFGGAVGVITLSHQFDERVRTHFVGPGPSSVGTHSLQDALPAFALLAGTWGYAQVIDDGAGLREAGTMLEASVLSVTAAYALNYASGRLGPNETTAPNHWWVGGHSFPSEHATAAFAIGTVLAESGSDDYRWVRRAIGYGVGGFTVYQRLSHDAHWLSDTVAGAALGAASARFAMNRRNPRHPDEMASFGIAPLPGGAMLYYSMQLR
jgi:membrane-associated phospholipid phosphatase